MFSLEDVSFCDSRNIGGVNFATYIQYQKIPKFVSSLSHAKLSES